MRRLFRWSPLILLAVVAVPVGWRVGRPLYNRLVAGPDDGDDGASASAPPPRAKDDGKALPTTEKMARLARTDPIAFLEAALRRYEREVKGYRCVLVKRESLNGKLQREEEVVCDFREHPFSVRMDWKRGARDAKRILYVKGEYKNRVQVLPTGALKRFGLSLLGSGIVDFSPNSPEVREASRYPPSEFGMEIGMRRALAAWKAARQRGDLVIEFLGEKPRPEVGGRVCWGLRRTGYKTPEDDGITDSTFYYDKENWLAVGNVLKGVDGKLIGSYYFRDVVFNPELGPETFTLKGLKR